MEKITVLPELHKMNCDDAAMQDLKDNIFRDNQAMIHLAHQYLLARGIK